MGELKLFHVADGFFDLDINGDVRVNVDPWYTFEEDGKRLKVRARPEPDFVLVSELNPQTIEDTLDILEATEATLVADTVLCDEAARELRMEEDRLLDLGAFESARCKWFRVTSFPIEVEKGGRGGLLGSIPLPSAVESAGDQLGSGPARMMQGMPLIGELSAMILQQARGSARTSGLGFALEVTGGPTMVFLSNAFCDNPDLDLLDELAEEFEDIDVVVAAAQGSATEGLVWCSRVLTPETFVLYRKQDPYALGSGGRNVPIARFQDALEEDNGDLEVIVLGQGDAYCVEIGKGRVKAVDPPKKASA